MIYHYQSGDVCGFLTLTTQGPTLKEGKKQPKSMVTWNANCICGTEIIVKEAKLIDDLERNNYTKTSCGCHMLKLKINDTIRKLTLIESIKINNEGRACHYEWRCKCSCGNEVFYKEKDLSGFIPRFKSCGRCNKDNLK